MNTYTLNNDGSLSVQRDNGSNADGSRAVESWQIPALQIKAHMDGMAVPGGRFSDIRAGDKSAALDAYNQRKAQAEQDAKNR